MNFGRLTGLSQTKEALMRVLARILDDGSLAYRDKKYSCLMQLSLELEMLHDPKDIEIDLVLATERDNLYWRRKEQESGC